MNNCNVLVCLNSPNDLFKAKKLFDFNNSETTKYRLVRTMDCVLTNEGKYDKDIFRKKLQKVSCVIFLINASTNNSKLINFILETSWEEKKGILGIYINSIEDKKGEKSKKGKNPFDRYYFGYNRLYKIVQSYDISNVNEDIAINFVKTSIANWIKIAIKTRSLQEETYNLDNI